MRSDALHIYVRWLADRRRSTIVWTLGVVIVSVATAAFYPALENMSGDALASAGAMSSILGLGGGIDPSTPLGFLWAMNYSNQLPWLLMALGIALGTASIAGDEEAGTLEYLLSKPVTRTQVAMARFAGVITILLVASLFNLLAVAATAPLFDLTTATTTTASDGSTVTNPGVSFGDLVVGGIAAFSVALGSASVAFFIGAWRGRKAEAMGISAGLAVGGYVFYTLSNVTGDLEALTWLFPWRWYINDAMMINGLTTDVLLPFALAAVCLLAGWQLFLHRDLQS